MSAIPQTDIGTQTGILTVPQAAAVLGIGELGFSRLIARRRIRATWLPVAGTINADPYGVDDINPAGPQTPQRGSWRVMASTLQQYISSGAPDLSPPLAFAADGWFNDRVEFYNAQGFISMFCEAALASLKSTVATFTPAERATLGGTDKPVERVLTAFTPAMRKAAAKDDALLAYLSQSLRNETKRVLQRGVGGAYSPAASLYASPRAYDAAVNEAITRLGKVNVDIGIGFFPGVVSTPNMAIHWSMPTSVLITEAGGATAIADAAF